MKIKKRPSRSFLALPSAERDRQVAKFDEEIDLEKDTRPLSPRQRAIFERWQGKSAKKQEVTLKLDTTTLRRCEAYAEKHRLTLSEVVDLGLATAFKFAK